MIRVKDIFVCSIYLLLTLVGMTLIKMGNRQEEVMLMQFMGKPISLKLLSGIICYGLSFLLFTLVVSKMQISIVLPLLSAINSICIVIIGMTIFQEIVSAGQMIGIGIVVIGTLVIGIFS